MSEESPHAEAPEEPQTPPESEEQSEPERVTDLAPPRQAYPGDCPDEELEQLRPVCMNADQHYRKVRECLDQVKESESVLQRFQAREGDLTPLDVEKAKKQFHAAKQSYIEAGNEINEGIKGVYDLAKSYPDDLLLQQLYRTYLAKLLASLQTRNRVEPLVQTLAGEPFLFDREPVGLTEEEERRGLTEERKLENRVEEMTAMVNRLETRYLKRQLQNRLRLGEKPEAIVQRVVALLKRDPEDLHTYIWLASLKLKLYESTKNQNRRVTLRDEVLQICKQGFALIDDFLTLQGIQDQTERDRRRAEYVRSITAIRKPLISG